VKINGARILIESLRREGVEVIFGYPGGVVLPIYDALYDVEGIRHILVRHEQGAVHAADGYARATGCVGVCLATSGPGACNLVSGIATAHMDSIPLVAITGQVKTTALGKDSFQEADVTGIMMPIVKHNFLVKDVRDLARTVKEAFHIASTGRPGPVVIDLPTDVCSATMEFSYPEKINMPGYKPYYEGHPMQIKNAARLIKKAKQPIILAGGGVVAAGASAELTKLARLTGIPVATSLMGKGVFPEDDPLSLGMLGMHGTAYSNYAVHEADLLIVIGARFDDRVTGRLDTFAPNASVIHIDIDPAEIGKSVAVDVPIVGDARNILQTLLEEVKPMEITAWRERIDEWRRQYPLSYGCDGTDGIKPQAIIETIHRLTEGKAIITTEVGQNQMWAAQFYKASRPRQFISSGGLGTMGYGLPAAIGAQIACPDDIVFDIAGDGSIQMNIQEMATAVSNKLPIKIAILNNGYLGMVRQWQQLFYDRRYSHTDIGYTNPDFIKLAEAYGAMGIRVQTPEEVEPALQRALECTDIPCIIDFIVAREENVMPMIPAGGSIDKMMVD
jgi:acetolactate synthase-1/2/3 large subunit